jgi:cell division protein FtsL
MYTVLCLQLPLQLLSQHINNKELNYSSSISKSVTNNNGGRILLSLSSLLLLLLLLVVVLVTVVVVLYCCWSSHLCLSLSRKKNFSKRKMKILKWQNFGYQSNKLSSVNTLYERSRSRTDEQSYISVCHVYPVSFDDIMLWVCEVSTLYEYKGDSSRLTICACHTWQITLKVGLDISLDI